MGCTSSSSSGPPIAVSVPLPVFPTEYLGFGDDNVLACVRILRGALEQRGPHYSRGSSGDLFAAGTGAGAGSSVGATGLVSTRRPVAGVTRHPITLSYTIVGPAPDDDDIVVEDSRQEAQELLQRLQRERASTRRSKRARTYYTSYGVDAKRRPVSSACMRAYCLCHVHSHLLRETRFSGELDARYIQSQLATPLPYSTLLAIASLFNKLDACSQGTVSRQVLGQWLGKQLKTAAKNGNNNNNNNHSNGSQQSFRQALADNIHTAIVFQKALETKDELTLAVFSALAVTTGSDGERCIDVSDLERLYPALQRSFRRQPSTHMGAAANNKGEEESVAAQVEGLNARHPSNVALFDGLQNLVAHRVGVWTINQFKASGRLATTKDFFAICAHAKDVLQPVLDLQAALRDATGGKLWWSQRQAKLTGGGMRSSFVRQQVGRPFGRSNSGFLNIVIDDESEAGQGEGSSRGSTPRGMGKRRGSHRRRKLNAKSSTSQYYSALARDATDSLPRRVTSSSHVVAASSRRLSGAAGQGDSQRTRAASVSSGSLARNMVLSGPRHRHDRLASMDAAAGSGTASAGAAGGGTVADDEHDQHGVSRRWSSGPLGGSSASMSAGSLRGVGGLGGEAGNAPTALLGSRMSKHARKKYRRGSESSRGSSRRWSRASGRASGASSARSTGSSHHNSNLPEQPHEESSTQVDALIGGIAGGTAASAIMNSPAKVART